MVHLLWTFGLRAWIAFCGLALVVLAVAWWVEGRHERRLGDRPWRE